MPRETQPPQLLPNRRGNLPNRQGNLPNRQGNLPGRVRPLLHRPQQLKNRDRRLSPHQQIPMSTPRDDSTEHGWPRDRRLAQKAKRSAKFLQSSSRTERPPKRSTRPINPRRTSRFTNRLTSCVENGPIAPPISLLKVPA